MVLATWYRSGAALYNCFEYALSQVGTHPDATRMLQGLEQPNQTFSRIWCFRQVDHICNLVEA